jgi:phage tail sheath protein FI|tara:strand:- start:2765 stop:4732 length:1968 start_codon:yes stop_codon:yes gene_type:complete
MAFQLSPGVLVKETDLTNIIPAVATSIGGMVIVSEKGPIDEITQISSEKELVDVFGKPDGNTFEYFFTAANFLQYANTLKVVRANTGNLNACVSGTAVQIKSTTHYQDNYASGQANVGLWAARTAGTHGNNLQVSMCTNANAYASTATSLVNSGSGVAVGATVVAVDTGSEFVVGDLIEFGDASGAFTSAPSGEYYEITGISSNNLTIKRNTQGGGTGLKQAVVDNAVIKRYWKYFDQFNSAPGTTTDVSNNGGSNDELHIIVIDEDGGISGAAGTILESYEGLSQASDAKTTSGATNFYADVIYNQSDFIYWMDHDTTLADAGKVKQSQSFDNAGSSATALFTSSLASGTDDNAPTNGELALSYDLFKDGETVDVNLLLTGPSQTGTDVSGVTKATAVIDVAESRKDIVAFISPARADVVSIQDAIEQTAKVKEFADALSSSSYAVLDSGYKYMYDKYNDVYRFVPLNGDIAGLCARTDNVADAWFSPAGLNRGQIRGSVKLAYSPNKSQRDTLYRARINPVATFPGQGTVLFGDKTMLSKPSAFDRINVRRLFIVLEKAISTASKFQLFEFNDEFTRAQFRNSVEPFLRDVQGRRGLTDFLVVCDDTNNTGEVIDRNEFRADIFIKPNRSINFITLNFVATRTGVSFSEVAGA